MNTRQSWFRRVLDAISQVLNVIIFNGDANSSISGDSYRYNIRWRMKIIDLIFSPFEKNHCKLAYEKDVALAYSFIQEHESKEKI